MGPTIYEPSFDLVKRQLREALSAVCAQYALIERLRAKGCRTLDAELELVALKATMAQCNAEIAGHAGLSADSPVAMPS